MLINIDLIDCPTDFTKPEDLPPGLLESIMEHGIVHLINVVALENGRYLIVNGLARLSVARLFRWTQIEAKVYPKTTVLAVKHMDLVAGKQRIKANLEDCYKAVKKLIDSGVTYKELSDRTNIPIATLRKWYEGV